MLPEKTSETQYERIMGDRKAEAVRVITSALQRRHPFWQQSHVPERPFLGAPSASANISISDGERQRLDSLQLLKAQYDSAARSGDDAGVYLLETGSLKAPAAAPPSRTTHASARHQAPNLVAQQIVEAVYDATARPRRRPQAAFAPLSTTAPFRPHEAMKSEQPLHVAQHDIHVPDAAPNTYHVEKHIHVIKQAIRRIVHPLATEPEDAPVLSRSAVPTAVEAPPKPPVKPPMASNKQKKHREQPVPIPRRTSTQSQLSISSQTLTPRPPQFARYPALVEHRPRSAPPALPPKASIQRTDLAKHRQVQHMHLMQEAIRRTHMQQQAVGREESTRSPMPHVETLEILRSPSPVSRPATVEPVELTPLKYYRSKHVHIMHQAVRRIYAKPSVDAVNIPRDQPRFTTTTHVESSVPTEAYKTVGEISQLSERKASKPSAVQVAEPQPPSLPSWTRRVLEPVLRKEPDRPQPAKVTVIPISSSPFTPVEENTHRPTVAVKTVARLDNVSERHPMSGVPAPIRAEFHGVISKTRPEAFGGMIPDQHVKATPILEASAELLSMPVVAKDRLSGPPEIRPPVTLKPKSVSVPATHAHAVTNATSTSDFRIRPTPKPENVALQPSCWSPELVEVTQLKIIRDTPSPTRGLGQPVNTRPTHVAVSDRLRPSSAPPVSRPPVNKIPRRIPSEEAPAAPILSRSSVSGDFPVLNSFEQS